MRLVTEISLDRLYEGLLIPNFDLSSPIGKFLMEIYPDGEVLRFYLGDSVNSDHKSQGHM